MKIGLVIEYFDPDRGGAEHWTFQLAQRLLEQGHQVHVVAQEFGPAAARLPIVACPLGPIRSRLRRAAAAERQLRALALDVIHDVGMGWHFDVFQSQDGSRVAQWERKLEMLPPYARPLKRRMIRLLPRYGEFRRLLKRQMAALRSDGSGRKLMAVSQMVAGDFERYHGVRPQQIRVVYNGVDTERFSPARRAEHRDVTRRRWGIGDDEVLSLFVGHDFRRKGLATAIRAVGRLATEGHPVRLIVVGRTHPQRYARLAHNCHAGGAVTFVGSVDDAAPLYAAADVYVLPTFYDPCSLGVMEAAASGLPSITTSVNGACELLCEGVDGYVLSDPTDDETLADRLRRLLDSARRSRMGQSARQMALQHTLGQKLQQTIAVYHEVAQARRRAA